MTTPLEKTVKRALRIKGRDYVVALSPESVKLTLKGHRIGVDLKWTDLIDGEAALATALNASLGKFAAESSRPVAKSKQKAKAPPKRRQSAPPKK
jgi:hypothetical protein